jgi:uncharacterized spore protein YtfJ
MDINQLFSTAQDALTVRRVYGDPYEQDGVTVIPAARVAGGVGGGSGQEQGQEGEGGGFGLTASPAGVVVIKDGTVRWMPTVDPHKVASTVGAVVIVTVLARTWVLTRALKAARSISD